MTVEPGAANPTRAYLALGSNLGDRAENIASALCLLNETPGVQISECSCLYETEPEDMAEAETGWFLNAAAMLETSLSPQALLARCLEIERRLGRVRPEAASVAAAEKGGSHCSRTLDIDLLFYGDALIQEDHLIVPHPRLHERSFVLVPMLELAFGFIHPALGKTLQELHLALDKPGEVRIFMGPPEFSAALLRS